MRQHLKIKTICGYDNKEEDKAVKKSARKDNRNQIEDKAALAEEAAK